jgi:hypothetical protein
LKLNRWIGRTAPYRLRRHHAVERFTLQMIEHVLRRVVLGAPGRVALVPDVDVSVDHAGHDGLAGKVDLGRAGRRTHRRRGAHGGDSSVLHDQRTAIDRRAVADDQPRPLEHRRGRARRLRRHANSGEHGQRENGLQRATHRNLHLHPTRRQSNDFHEDTNRHQDQWLRELRAFVVAVPRRF